MKAKVIRRCVDAKNREKVYQPGDIIDIEADRVDAGVAAGLLQAIPEKKTAEESIEAPIEETIEKAPAPKAKKTAAKKAPTKKR